LPTGRNIANSNRRKAARVSYLIAIDGTWRRICIMEDVSETGAKLTVEKSIVGV
jgi:hypothetical protein